MTNPYTPGVFYTGSFVTQQFAPSFASLLANQRLAVLVEIAAKPSYDVMPISRYQSQPEQYDPTLNHFFYLDDTGAFLRSDTDPPTNATLHKRFIMSPPIPYYWIFADENGDARYVTVDGSLNLTASDTLSGSFTTADGHFCGDYLDVVEGTNGTGIWRITVNSSNVISTAQIAVESKRAETLRFSHGHPSPYDDVNGHLWIPALISFGDIRSSIPQFSGGFAGISSPSFGEIEIQLADQEYLFLAEQGWDTRVVTVKAGLTTDPISEYPVIFRGQSSQAQANLNTLTITMRDSSILFRKSIQTQTYSGGGGYSGSDQLEGVVRPIAYGQIGMAPAVLIDEDINLYQIHDGPINAIAAVFTGAARMTDLGDLNGLADLTVWSPTQADVDAGGFRTDLANGMVRLAATPTAPITADFWGSTSVPLGDNSIGTVLSAFIADKLPDVTLDTNAMSAFIARWPQANAYFYKTEETSIGDALRELVEPMGASIALTRLNQLRVTMLERAPAKALIQSHQIVESGRSPIRREPPTPALTYRVGGRKNIRLNETDILANANPVSRQRAIGPVSFVSYSPWGSGAKRYDSAGNIEHLVNVHQLNDSTSRRKILYNLAYRDYFFQNLYEFTVIGFLYQFELGDTILFELPELGVTQPKTGIIVSITERSPTRSSEDLTDLLVWSH